MNDQPAFLTTSLPWIVRVRLLHFQVSQGRRDLLVDLGGNARGCDIEMNVILLVQAEVAVAHEIECVDIPKT